MKMFIAILMLPVNFIIDMYGRIQEYFRLKCEGCGGSLVFYKYDERINRPIYECMDCGRKHIL